jgi:hypothetical protein
MNVHSTLHAGGPSPEELVPSRYAVRIGDINVLVVTERASSRMPR